ncbi:hypothetical protein SLS57_004231 [Botryosphaeria dothidea]
MNLELLDYIKEVKELSWVGTANELGAAYAADGYCRVKQSPGVSMFGNVPTQVFQMLTVSHCWLDDISTAPAEVDRVLRTCLETSLPVYIFVPMDFVHPLVDKPSPSNPLDVPPAAIDPALVNSILSEIYSAKSPVILVDALVSRHRATAEARQLLDILRFPTFSTPMGKSIANEAAPYFHSTYNGKVSFPGVAATIENASDLVIDLGPILSDSNTGAHTRTIADDKLVSIHPHTVTVRKKSYPGTSIRGVLAALVAAIDPSRVPSIPRPDLPPEERAPDADAEAITQSWIWRRIGAFVRPGDVLIGEAGTAQFGLSDAVFPADLTYVTQIYYGSIGYALPACLGAAVAKREKGGRGRVVLVTGDGSAQLTAQEVGTMVKLGLGNVLILVINNAGYTIERAIHGPEEEYNDIAAWDWQLMLSFFGDKHGKERSREVRTKKEFEAALGLPEYTSPESIQVLEVHMDKMDIPWRLNTQIGIVRARAQAAAIKN